MAGPSATSPKKKYNGLTREMINFPSEEVLATTKLGFTINFDDDDDTKIRNWTKEQAQNFKKSASVLTEELLEKGYVKVQLVDAFSDTDATDIMEKWRSTVNVFTPPAEAPEKQTLKKIPPKQKKNLMEPTTEKNNANRIESARRSKRLGNKKVYSFNEEEGEEEELERENEAVVNAEDNYTNYVEDDPDPNNIGGMPACFVWLMVITKIGVGIFSHERWNPRLSIKKLPPLENISVGELSDFYDDLFGSDVDTVEGQRKAVVRYYKVLETLKVGGPSLLVPYIFSFRDISDTLLDHTAFHGLNFKCPDPEDPMFLQLSEVVGEGENQHRVGNNEGNTNPMLFWGFAMAGFSLHIEDFVGVNAINKLLLGKPKVWNFIPSLYCYDVREKVHAFYKINKPANFEQEAKHPCVVQHKMTLIDGNFLKGINGEQDIPFNIVIQRKAQLVITGACAHHYGFNIGLNLAIAVSTLLGDFHTAANVLHLQCRKHEPKDPYRQVLIKRPELRKWLQYSSAVDSLGRKETVDKAVEIAKAEVTALLNAQQAEEIRVLKELLKNREPSSPQECIVPELFDHSCGVGVESMRKEGMNITTTTTTTTSCMTMHDAYMSQPLKYPYEMTVQENVKTTNGTRAVAINAHYDHDYIIPVENNVVVGEKFDIDTRGDVGDYDLRIARNHDSVVTLPSLILVKSTENETKTDNLNDTTTTMTAGGPSSPLTLAPQPPVMNNLPFLSLEPIAHCSRHVPNSQETTGTIFSERKRKAQEGGRNYRYKNRKRTYHEERAAKGNTQHFCPFCKKSFCKISDFKPHVQNKSCWPWKKCPRCNHIGFAYYKQYRRHRKECPGGAKESDYTSSDEE